MRNDVGKIPQFLISRLQLVEQLLLSNFYRFIFCDISRNSDSADNFALFVEDGHFRIREPYIRAIVTSPNLAHVVD